MRTAQHPNFNIRKVTIEDIPEVYKILTANRPYVGLNSRYTYFLLARDFSDTCAVAEIDGHVVAFSSGYIPPARPDTFFNWEIVVHEDYRGFGLQKQMLLYQIKMAQVQYFEGTVNPSNEVSKKNYREIARLLNAVCTESLLFSEQDFGNDGHEEEILFRIGPIPKEP
jgi:L-2,4-diaminobutyric acid acetyltransferase